MVMGVGAEIDDVLELAPEIALRAGLHKVGMLGPHHHGDAARWPQTVWQSGADHRTTRELHHGFAAIDLGRMAFEEIGLTDEIGDEPLGRPVIDVTRGADLQDLALRHDGNPVRHGEGFFLVMGHEDEGDARLMLQPLQFDLHVLAELVVKGRERLIEEKHLWRGGERAGQRHALLLPAGDLAGLAVPELFHLNELQHLADAGLDLSPGLAQHLEAEADVLTHRHVGKQRIALEHGIHRPLVGRQGSDVLAMEQDVAFGREVETGDQPQERGLSAAGGPQQGEELVLADRDRNVIEGLDGILPGTLE